MNWDSMKKSMLKARDEFWKNFQSGDVDSYVAECLRSSISNLICRCLHIRRDNWRGWEFDPSVVKDQFRTSIEVAISAAAKKWVDENMPMFYFDPTPAEIKQIKAEYRSQVKFQIGREVRDRAESAAAVAVKSILDLIDEEDAIPLLPVRDDGGWGK